MMSGRQRKRRRERREVGGYLTKTTQYNSAECYITVSLNKKFTDF